MARKPVELPLICSLILLFSGIPEEAEEAETDGSGVNVYKINHSYPRENVCAAILLPFSPVDDGL